MMVYFFVKGNMCQNTQMYFIMLRQVRQDKNPDNVINVI